MSKTSLTKLPVCCTILISALTLSAAAQNQPAISSTARSQPDAGNTKSSRDSALLQRATPTDAGPNGDLYLNSPTPFTTAGVLLQAHSGFPNIVAKLGTADSTASFGVDDFNNSVLFRVGGDGNVGVGTNAASFPLDIQRNGSTQVVATSFGGGSGHFEGRSAGGTQASPTATQSDDFLAILSGHGFQAPAFTGGVARMTIRAAEQFTSGHQGAYITFDTTAVGTTALTERVRIDSAGRVGIGTTPATGYMLDVNGAIRATSVIGAVYQDLAEWVPATEHMAAGTVVVLNPDRKNEVMPSAQAYDTAVAGVVSAAPGIILGEGSDSKAKIATTGRVKVRVDASGNAIRIGDLLVTSDKSGAAMKSEPIEMNGRHFHQPGTILGKALEPLESGRGEILVLLSLQ